MLATDASDETDSTRQTVSHANDRGNANDAVAELLLDSNLVGTGARR
jgi:hypothetical protein